MKRCPSCGRTHDDPVMACDCGQDLAEVEPTRMDEWRPPPEYLSRGFATFAFFGGCLMVLAWVALVVAVVSAVVTFFSGGILAGFLVLLAGLVHFVTLYAFSEGVRMLIVIREEVREGGPNVRTE